MIYLVAGTMKTLIWTGRNERLYYILHIWRMGVCLVLGLKRIPKRRDDFFGRLWYHSAIDRMITSSLICSFFRSPEVT